MRSNRTLLDSGPDAEREDEAVTDRDDVNDWLRVHVDYHDGQSWRDLWLLTLDEHGRCEHFEEWPFAPEQDDGH